MTMYIDATRLTFGLESDEITRWIKETDKWKQNKLTFTFLAKITLAGTL